MSLPLKNLFEIAGRLLVPGVHQSIDGAELAGPPRPTPLRLAGNTRVVLQRLADRVNFSSNTAEARTGAWISRTALAVGTMSVKTVDRALAELKWLGFIKVEARFCGPGKCADSQLSNLYTFHPDAISACKGAGKFTSAVVIPVAGLVWPKVRKHGLKKAERKNGFPFENRCKPRQNSVSEPPGDKMTRESSLDTAPGGTGLGAWIPALPKKEEGRATAARSGRLSVLTGDRQGLNLVCPST